jgi:hypothetical protein
MASFNQQYFNPYYIPQVSTGTVYSSIEGFQSTMNPTTRLNASGAPQVPMPATQPTAQATVAPKPPVTAQPIKPTQISQPVKPTQIEQPIKPTQIAQNNRPYRNPPQPPEVPKSDRWDRQLPSNKGRYWRDGQWRNRYWRDGSWYDSDIYYNQPRTVYIPAPVVAPGVATDLSYCNQYADCGGMNADPTSCTKCVADRQGSPACANYVCNDCASNQKCAVWKGNPYYSCRRCMGEQNANPACADQICGPDPNA